MGRFGVLLLNLGGPDHLEDVRPFLFNLFSDPEIIRLPFPWLQRPLAWLISTTRAKKSQENYQQIGGGSPLRRITDEQPRRSRYSFGKRGMMPMSMSVCAIGILTLRKRSPVLSVMGSIAW
jgi:ferrochelatase